VDGRTLDNVLSSEGALQPARAVRIAHGVLVALAAAHGEGLHHGHLEPADIVIGSDDRVVVIGIGLPSLSLAARSRYAPPGDETVGAGSDVYAIGFILAEMLAGHPIAGRAYPGGPLPGVVASSPLGVVVHRAIERDQSRRYPSARAMGDHLAAVARQLGLSLPASVTPMQAMSVAAVPSPGTADSPRLSAAPLIAASKVSRAGAVGKREVKRSSAGGIMLLFALLGTCAASAAAGVVVFLVWGRKAADVAEVASAPSDGLGGFEPGSFGRLGRSEIERRVLETGWTVGNTTLSQASTFSLLVLSLERSDGSGSLQLYNYDDPALAARVEAQVLQNPAAAVRRSGGSVVVVIAGIAGGEPGATARALLAALTGP
jgi:hypothetical protein